jgi:hypothetical protein
MAFMHTLEITLTLQLETTVAFIVLVVKPEIKIQIPIMLLCPDMAKLSGENASKNQPQMSLPSQTKKRLCGLSGAEFGWGTSLFLL